MDTKKTLSSTGFYTAFDLRSFLHQFTDSELQSMYVYGPAMAGTLESVALVETTLTDGSTVNDIVLNHAGGAL